MKKLITPLFFILSILCASAEDKQYNEHGFSFTYNSDLTIAVTGGAIKTIVAKNDIGTQFLMQNYKNLITPEKLKDMMVNSLIQKFGAEKASVLTNRTTVRPILGEKREGANLLIVEKGIPIECIVFIFKEGENTYCCMTQQALTNTPQAEKYFAQIQSTLKSGN